MMKWFLLPALAAAVLAGSAKAEDSTTATTWVCARQASSTRPSGPGRFVVNGNELKIHNETETLPKEELQALNYTPPALKIVLNDQIGLIAILPDAGKYSDGINASAHVVVINQNTGNYLETILSPDPSAGRPPQNDIEKGTCIAG